MATWIFLRGLTRDSRHWGDFIDAFKNAFPDHPIVTLDLAGNGHLHQRSSRTRVPDMVRDCRVQLESRGIAPPYHVLALSLGAMVALAWALAYPREIAAQVLINTSFRPFNPFYERLRPANYGRFLQLLLSNAGACEWERAILQMTSNRRDTSVLPLWISWRLANPVTPRNALRQLSAAAQFEAPSDAPLVPTLLLASANDQLVSVRCSRVLARQWVCPLVEHPSAGHDVALDDGKWVTDQVRAWLLKLDIPY